MNPKLDCPRRRIAGVYLGRAVCAARCSPRTQQLSGHSAHTRESMRSSVRVSTRSTVVSTSII